MTPRETARDVAYTAVGLGVLLAQAIGSRLGVDPVAKVLNGGRTLRDGALGHALGPLGHASAPLAPVVQRQLRDLDERLEHLETELGPLLAEVRSTIPPAAAPLVNQAAQLASVARKQLRDWAGRAVAASATADAATAAEGAAG